VVYEGVVYDTSAYGDLHPGGKHFLEEHYGRSIDKPFDDQEHSKSAKRQMKTLPKVGYILGKTKEEPKEKAQAVDRDGNVFAPGALQVDYDKGIFNQLWNRTDYTREQYIQFINEPKHLINPVRDCRMFNPDFVEFFSKTPWYGIPLFYIPWIASWLYCALEVY
jgi:4-hydroxysphinganine ceramide fatty acyl 2-hydroxylase